MCCSLAAVAASQYRAVNEPVCMYKEGTSERAQLDAALQKFNSEVYDVPVIVGEEEIRSGDVCLQPKVLSCNFLFSDDTLIFFFSLTFRHHLQVVSTRGGRGNVTVPVLWIDSCCKCVFNDQLIKRFQICRLLLNLLHTVFASDVCCFVVAAV